MSITLDFLSFDNEHIVITDGPYDSLQLTYDQLRDADDRIIATRERNGDGWTRPDDTTVYPDIVIYEAPA